MVLSRGPEFLPGEQHLTDKRVRCPVQGFVRYSKAEQAIIDHGCFQRLRNIRQLAFTHYVYPGAVHSRFEHSLGVMELATQAFDQLVLSDANLLYEHISSVPAFTDNTLAKARQLVRLMGLLHDVGHTAFSHAGETLLPKPKRHEIISGWIVSNKGPLGKMLDETFFEGISDFLSKLLLEDDEDPPPPQLLVLGQLVSGQLDFDRTDYLLRDSLHCGVEYGKFDHLRLIGSLVPHFNEHTASVAVGVEPGGFHTFEALILARYYMNTQVYMHKTRRAFDLVLEQWLHSWGAEHFASPEDVLKYDDVVLTYQMAKDVEDLPPEDPRARWAKRLLMRDHPRLVWERGDHADIMDRDTAQRILRTLKAEFTDVEFLFDDNAKGAIHKLYVPGDVEEVDNIFIVERNGSTYPLSYRSKVIEKIPKRFWVLRIFAYFKDAAQREAVTRRAVEIEHSL